MQPVSNILEPRRFKLEYFATTKLITLFNNISPQLRGTIMIQIRWRQRLLHPVALALGAYMMVSATHAAEEKKPNIVIIWGDDIGQTNVCLLYTSDAADE